MVRRDFEKGGFPINRRCPAIVVSASQGVFVAYNRYTLCLILRQEKIIVKCLGIWPGKTNTDCFILNPDYYREPSPPKRYQFIDDSQDIKIYLRPGGKFVKVTYIEDTTGNPIEVVSEDENLANYISRIGLRHAVIHE